MSSPIPIPRSGSEAGYSSGSPDKIGAPRPETPRARSLTSFSGSKSMRNLLPGHSITCPKSYPKKDSPFLVAMNAFFLNELNGHPPLTYQKFKHEIWCTIRRGYMDSEEDAIQAILAQIEKIKFLVGGVVSYFEILHNFLNGYTSTKPRHQEWIDRFKGSIHQIVVVKGFGWAQVQEKIREIVEGFSDREKRIVYAAFTSREQYGKLMKLTEDVLRGKLQKWMHRAAELARDLRTISKTSEYVKGGEGEGDDLRHLQIGELRATLFRGEGVFNLVRINHEPLITTSESEALQAFFEKCLEKGWGAKKTNSAREMEQFANDTETTMTPFLKSLVIHGWLRHAHLIKVLFPSIAQGKHLEGKISYERLSRIDPFGDQSEVVLDMRHHKTSASPILLQLTPPNTFTALQEQQFDVGPFKQTGMTIQPWATVTFLFEQLYQVFEEGNFTLQRKVSIQEMVFDPELTQVRMEEVIKRFMNDIRDREDIMSKSELTPGKPEKVPFKFGKVSIGKKLKKKESE